MNVESLFLTLLNMSISASWLALAILILRLLFKKAPKVLFCLLWALVGIRLAFPFSIESILSLIPSADTVPPEIIYSPAPEINTGIPAVNNAVNPIISTILTPKVDAEVTPAFTLTQIASIVWLVGFAVMIVYGAVSYFILHRKVAASIEIEKRVLICDDIKSPFILGFIVPHIYIPSEIKDEKRCYILAHEKAHLKRGDHLWKPIGFALLSVYWFNPVMWLAYIMLCKDIELACDEKVITGMSDKYKKEYSETLLSCSAPRKLVSACPLAFGEVGVKERIKSVMSYKKPTFWIALVSVVAIVVTAVCFMTDPKKDEQPQSESHHFSNDILTVLGYESSLNGIYIEVTDVTKDENAVKVKVKWTNEALSQIMFGEPFFIEVYTENTSKQALEGDTIFTTQAFGLNANSTRSHTYTLSRFSLEEGKKYRFSTSFSAKGSDAVHTVSFDFYYGEMLNSDGEKSIASKTDVQIYTAGSSRSKATFYLYPDGTVSTVFHYDGLSHTQTSYGVYKMTTEAIVISGTNYTYTFPKENGAYVFDASKSHISDHLPFYTDPPQFYFNDNDELKLVDSIPVSNYYKTDGNGETFVHENNWFTLYGDGKCTLSAEASWIRVSESPISWLPTSDIPITFYGTYAMSGNTLVLRVGKPDTENSSNFYCKMIFKFKKSGDSYLFEKSSSSSQIIYAATDDALSSDIRQTVMMLENGTEFKPGEKPNIFMQTNGGFRQYPDGSWCAPMAGWDNEVILTEVGTTATFVNKDGQKFVFTRDGDLYRFVPEESDPLSSVGISYNEKVVFERRENHAFYDFFPIVEIMRGDLDGDGKEEALYVGPDTASGVFSFSLHLYEGNKFEGRSRITHTSIIRISQDMKLTMNGKTYDICFVDGVPMLSYDGKLYKENIESIPE